jgi:hypothetical protein
MKSISTLFLILLASSVPPGRAYQIDLASRRIDGINFTGTLSQIRGQLGKNAIQVLPRDAISDQGDRVIDTLWIISISGHEIIRYSKRASILVEDSFFRTKEGLGVGSSIQEFVDHYGIPRFHEEDIGYTLIFKVYGLELQVYIDPDCNCQHDFATLDKQCSVSNFIITVPA